MSTQWNGNPSRHHLFTHWWHHPAMEPTGRVLGPASTNFNDYLGTVAADDAEAVMYEPSLYELAELDRDRYTILAVDLRVEGRTTATVYAIDRVQHPVDGVEELLPHLDREPLLRQSSSTSPLVVAVRPTHRAR
jgi:hypothetical protein